MKNWKRYTRHWRSMEAAGQLNKWKESFAGCGLDKILFPERDNLDSDSLSGSAGGLWKSAGRAELMSVLTAEGGNDGVFFRFMEIEDKKALYLEAGRWQQGKWKSCFPLARA